MFKYLFLICLFTLPVMAEDVIFVEGQSNAVALRSHVIEERFEELTGRDVKIVNCAEGGSFIRDHLAEHFVPRRSFVWARCRGAMAAEHAAGNKIIGVIFWQGESDLIHPGRRPRFRNDRPFDWPFLFDKVVKNNRYWSGNSELPFVVFTVSQWNSGPCKIPNYHAPFISQLIEQQKSVKNFYNNFALIETYKHFYYDCRSPHMYAQPTAYSELSTMAAEKLAEFY